MVNEKNMSNVSIINKVKYNRRLYKLYRNYGGFILRQLKKIVKPDDKLILFVSFGGRRYDDSPRCIYEAMIEDTRFDGCQLVWAFINPDRHELKGRGEKVKIDTLAFFKTALKARVWVNNSNVSRGLPFKGRHTFDFDTWHGSAIKKIGYDVENNFFGNSKNTKPTKKASSHDVFCAQSTYDVEVFSQAFNMPEDIIKVIGLPRNDELVSRNNEETIADIKQKLNIPLGKTVILYAPTFREYNRDEGNNCVLVPPMNLEKWGKELGDSFVFLFRSHYEVIKYIDVDGNSFVKNVSNYPNLNELMLISDVCLSDYSSIFFDYSILGRPMLCWAYDFEEYSAKRGLYFDIRQALCCEDVQSEDDLIDFLKKMNVEERKEITKVFRDKYVTEFGNATKKSLDIIADELDR